jgi:nucleotide-binding universal stress UspA family protein
MLNRYLLAIDRYESRHAAVRLAASLAADTGADVIVFHVQELPANGRIPPLETVKDAWETVEEALSELRAAGVRAEGLVGKARAGYVGRRIVDESLQSYCRGIILGSRRLHGWERILGHGVREQVIRLADVPVIAAPALSAKGDSGSGKESLRRAS